MRACCNTRAPHFTPEKDGSSSKEYSQRVAVVVVAAADGTAALKKPTATGQMYKVKIGWFLVRYEDYGVEEWLRPPGNAFNNNARGSWRVDLDFEASGGIESGGAAAVTSAYAATAAAVVAVAAMNPRTAIAATRTRTRTATVVAAMGATSEVL